MTNNNHKRRNISPTFITFILAFLLLLGYFCFRLLSITGTIKFSEQKTEVIPVDTNQIKLNTKDSIIALKDLEIAKLKEEIAKGPDTVYIKPKPIIKKVDTTSLSVTKVDSLK